MPITISELEDIAISANLSNQAVINRLVALVNDLEQRIETLENP